MFGRRNDWHKIRSTHASVLESLEQVIERHPANWSPRVVEVEESESDAHDASDGAGAVVLQFRPRLSTATSAPDGAA